MAQAFLIGPSTQVFPSEKKHDGAWWIAWELEEIIACVWCAVSAVCAKKWPGVCMLNQFGISGNLFLIINIILVCIFMLLLNSYNLIYRRSYGGSQRWIQEFYDVTLCFQKAYVTSCLAGWFGRLHHNLPGKVVEKYTATCDTVCTLIIVLHISIFCEIPKDVDLHIGAIDAFSSVSR